jgi:NAD(P)-dependent dehydrogenase (short-subunit alcohol dehydrogenase family)
MRFRDKVALITAAGSGIGRATAEIIASEGGLVTGVDTDKARLDCAGAGTDRPCVLWLCG